MTASFSVSNPAFRERVTASFTDQQVMHTLGARLMEIQPGRVVIELPYQQALTQQHGFLHAGIVTTVIDSACGYAAFTLMPADAEILSVEFKINLLSPARGEKLIAVGQVIKAGRNLTVCHGDAFMQNGDRQKPVAHMVGTMMAIHNRDDLKK